MMHCIFIPGSPKSTFSKYSFGREGGVTKKEYSVYAFDNADNDGRPQLDFLPESGSVDTCARTFLRLRQTSVFVHRPPVVPRRWRRACVYRGSTVAPGPRLSVPERSGSPSASTGARRVDTEL